MFFTFERIDYRAPISIPEVLVCVEGDSVEDILGRAEWFGLDFSNGPGGRRREWTNFAASHVTSTPRLGRRALETINDYHWIIVYADGNLQSNLAIPCDDECDLSFLNPAFDIDP